MHAGCTDSNPVSRSSRPREGPSSFCPSSSEAGCLGAERHGSRGMGTPMARRTPRSTSRRRFGERGPPKGERRTSSWCRVVICSHFRTDAAASPPSPRRRRTCVGAIQSVVVHGTTRTSDASAFLTLGEMIRTGRSLSSCARCKNPRRRSGTPRSRVTCVLASSGSAEPRLHGQRVELPSTKRGTTHPLRHAPRHGAQGSRLPSRLRSPSRRPRSRPGGATRPQRRCGCHFGRRHSGR